MNDQRTVRQIFEEEGYVIVDGIVTPEFLEPLMEACDQVVQKARIGEWKLRRVVGVPFPPWNIRVKTFGE